MQDEKRKERMEPQLQITSTDALLLVDVQNDFCPGGALAVPEGDQIIEPIHTIIDRFPLVVASQDWHPPHHCSFRSAGGEWPTHCVAGTVGADFPPALRRSSIDLEVKKGHQPDREAYSAFEGEPDLAELLRLQKVQRLFIAGLATDYCVRATVLDARKKGFEVVVLTDVVRGVDVQPGDSAKALQEMAAAGAVLATTKDLAG